MFNLYVIGIDYVQSSQELCLQHVLALRPIFLRYSNQENDKRLIFLKKGVGVQGCFSG